MWISSAYDWMTAVAVALGGIAAVLLAVGPGWTAATVVATAACAGFARVRVQVDEHDVRIAFGP